MSSEVDEDVGLTQCEVIAVLVLHCQEQRAGRRHNHQEERERLYNCYLLFKAEYSLRVGCIKDNK